MGSKSKPVTVVIASVIKPGKMEMAKRALRTVIKYHRRYIFLLFPLGWEIAYSAGIITILVYVVLVSLILYADKCVRVNDYFDDKLITSKHK